MLIISDDITKNLVLSYFDFSDAAVPLLLLKLFILPFDFCWFLLQRSSDKEKKYNPLTNTE